MGPLARHSGGICRYKHPLSQPGSLQVGRAICLFHLRKAAVFFWHAHTSLGQFLKRQITFDEKEQK
jgi:hypothetical protein